jgi:hypothetical protein
VNELLLAMVSLLLVIYCDSVYPFTRRVIKLTVVIIMGYHSYQLHNKLLLNILFSRLSLYVDEIVKNHQCGF